MPATYGIFCDDYESPTIENCVIDSAAFSGIFLDNYASPIIKGCIIKNNRSRGIYADLGTENTRIENCLVINNETTGNGGGIFCYRGSPDIINCTITENTAAKGGGIYVNEPTALLKMRNSIVWNNSANTAPAIYTSNYDITYSNFECVLAGKGNLETDPLFADSLFHLQQGSPCIDAGDPNDAHSLETNPNGDRINMGYYGNRVEAATGTNNTPIITQVLPDLGSPAGGIQDTIKGRYFGTMPDSVFYGTKPAEILSWTDSMIICIVPAQPSGPVTVEVQAMGNNDALTFGFTYTGPKVVRVPSQKETIQKGIDYAAEGDTVLVAPGRYTGQGNTELELLGKAITLISEAGPAETIIDCENSGRGFFIHQQEELETVISGFRITNAGTYGIFCDDYESPTIENCVIDSAAFSGIFLDNYASPIIKGCVIKNNRSRGIYADLGTQNARIENCLIIKNQTTGNGGGIFCYRNAPDIINCTIADNIGVNGSAIYANDGLLRVRNSIIWDRGQQQCSISNQSTSIVASDYDIQYCNINWGVYGSGNIAEPPLFVNPEGNDYHLHPNSPCIDAGAPEDEYNDEPGLNGDRINMGVYGNTIEAAVKSEAPIPLAGEPSDNSGCLEGGGVMTITGYNFEDIADSIYFGTTLVEDIISWSDQELEFVVPPAITPGAVDITISNPAGESFTLQGAFTYALPDTVYITADTVSGIWSSKCLTTYILTDTVVVPENETLIIEAGAQVLADSTYAAENVWIKVDGILKAEGTAEKPILFSTAGLKEAGTWEGIFFGSRGNTSDECGQDELSRLSYCTIEYATTGVHAQDEDILIEHSTIQFNSLHGIWWDGDELDASGKMLNCFVFDNEGWGVYCTSYCRNFYGHASAEIIGSEISRNEEGGIYLEATGGSPSSWCWPGCTTDIANTNPIIKNNTISQNNGYAFQAYARGTRTPGTIGTHASIAIIDPIIENNVVFENASCIKIEAPYFSFGGWLSHSNPQIINSTFWDNGPEDFVVMDSANIEIYNSTFWDGLPSDVTIENGMMTIANSNFDVVHPGDNNTAIQPLFMATNEYNFRLQNGSPLIDSGENSNANEDLDLVGNIRIWDGNGDGSTIIDKGAFEFDSPEYLLPTVSAPDNYVLCEGESLNLQIESTGYNLSYQWLKNGEPLVDGNENSVSIDATSSADAGNYICVITDGLGAIVSSEEIIVHIIPNLNISVDITATTDNICSGDEIIFTATPENEGASPLYQWQINGMDANASDTIFVAEQLNDGDIIHCIVTSSAQCTIENPVISNDITVTVNPLPEVVITSNSPVCEGETISLQATGGLEYSWTGPSEFSSNNPNVMITSATEAFDGYFTALVTAENGCTNSDSVEIVVNPLPEVSITGETAICADETAVLTATEGLAGYQWSNGAATASIDVTEAGNYMVTVTDNNGCQNSTAWVLDVNELPIVTLDDFDPACVIEAAFELAGGLPQGGTYEGPGVENNLFDPSQAGVGGHVITFSYTDATTGCSNSTTADIEVAQSLNVEVQVDASPLEFCLGESTTLTASASNGGEVPAYQWFVDGMPTGTNSETLLLEDLSVNTEVYCVLTSSAFCTTNNPATSAITQLIVNPLPEISITGEAEICADESALLTATEGLAAYQWSNGAATASIDVTQAGNYMVTVTDNNGCQNSAEWMLNVNELPIVTLDEFDLACVIEAEFELTGGLPQGGTYEGPGVENNLFDPSQAEVGSHTITYSYTDATTGCSNSTIADIEVAQSLNVEVQVDASPLEFCLGESTTLTASASNGGEVPAYQWFVDGMPTGTNSETLLLEDLSVNTEVYCVLTSSAFCTTNNPATSTITQLIVNPLPEVSITGEAAICADESALLTATEGLAAYQWSNGAATASIDVTEAGNYMVTVTDNNGCQNSAAWMLNVNDLPIVTLDNFDPACVIETAFELTGGLPQGGVYEGPGVENNLFDPSQAGVGSHVISYSYTDATTGCSNSTTADIEVAQSLNVEVQLDASPLEFCLGESTTLTASASNGGEMPVYQWFVDGMPSGTNSETLLLEDLSVNTEVYCVLTSSAFCTTNNPTTSAITQLIVNPLPDVSLALMNSDTINIVTDPTTFELSGGMPEGGEYEGPGVLDNIFDPVEAGTGLHLITYTYTDPETDCQNTAIDSILVVNTTSNGQINDDEQIHLFPNPTEGVSYLSMKGFSGFAVLTIMDIHGRPIYNKQQWYTGIGVYELDLSNQPKGLYILKIEIDDRIISRRLVVQ